MRGGVRTRTGRPAAFACALITALAWGRGAVAGPALSERELNENSLPLRTALHHDPSLASPFTRLLAMYREAGRVEALMGMYRGHLAQYPADASATCILVRLLLATGAPEAEAAARGAAQRHPEHAYLRYLLYSTLSARARPGALAQLDAAISLEKRADRKRTWIEELLPKG